jgi:acetylornithine deacetylase/succinyl-diaminopimelate desuccinylase-like protein
MSSHAIKYADKNRRRFVKELCDLVKIPSCSFPGYPAKEVQRSAKAVAGYLKKVGLEHVEILRLPGVHPYVYADWLHAPGAPTLLLYAHHDVQPPGRRELWKSPPYTPTERRGRLFARGAADDKAGICVHGAAIESWLKTEGRLPVNVKLIIEGEEEIGSENLERFLRKYHRKLSADAMVLTDTGNFDVGLPSITTSLRGLVAFDVTLRTADHPLHSGMWGGPLPDPAIALAKMLATLTDAQGRMSVEGLRKDVRPLTSLEKKSFASLRYNDKKFRQESGLLKGVHITGGKSSLLHKMWREPSVSVNAIEVSSRKNLSNIISEKAWCHLGIRIVPDMQPARTAKLLQRHLKKHAPWGAKVEFGAVTTANWWATDPKGKAFAAAQRAMSKGFKRNGVFVGCGGTIPFVEPFAKVLGGVPALLIGVEDPYTNPHSENESLHLADFQKSIRSSIHLYGELARDLA